MRARLQRPVRTTALLYIHAQLVSIIRISFPALSLSPNTTAVIPRAGKGAPEDMAKLRKNKICGWCSKVVLVVFIGQDVGEIHVCTASTVSSSPNSTSVHATLELIVTSESDTNILGTRSAVVAQVLAAKLHNYSDEAIQMANSNLGASDSPTDVHGHPYHTALCILSSALRSEERRVGKECA